LTVLSSIILGPMGGLAIFIAVKIFFTPIAMANQHYPELRFHCHILLMD
jgi:hypothetical protein